jgi:hypothetical protein
MSETDVTVAWIEIYCFIATKYLWYKGLRNRKDFIMQNCSVRSGCKQERFYNAELLCGEMEENGILV